jgi:acetylornithine deacetylase/succinyl-diaminopimelate desuccinylase-like protein
MSDRYSEYIKALNTVEGEFNKKPIPVQSGGSIPFVATFERIPGIKSILLGFGFKSDSIHSPDENFLLSNYFKGIETISLYFKYYKEHKIR